MKHKLSLPLLALLASALMAPAAQAGCYADYKAKRDNPLRLHYGVAELKGGCDLATARAELPGRLAQDGWILLTVVAVFDDTGLQERKESAGRYFLRY